MPQNPGALKRQKELARLEWQREKAAKKERRKTNTRDPSAGGEDPDIAGIIPGPQPLPE
jgi:hypothetical protein